MTKAQWKAIYDYCEENGFTTGELIQALRGNGTVDRNARLEDLGDYVSGCSYDTMMRFLEENLWR